jgi:hypothetical protein
VLDVIYRRLVHPDDVYVLSIVNFDLTIGISRLDLDILDP